MYKLLRNFLFLFPAEGVHYFSMNMLKQVCRISIIKKYLAGRYTLSDPSFEKKMSGLHFRNPVGLAAGFDKNARYLSELELLGFGFVEIGTVTPKAQDGNERPRLFRLKEDQALINRMGFNNDGATAVAARLERWQRSRTSLSNDGRGRMLIGGNIGKSKQTPNEDAWKDYESCFTALFDVVDYFVVNVSSPNTPGLRALQEKDALRKILVHLQTLNINKNGNQRPIFLKIAPDLEWQQIDDVISLAKETGLDGLVVANTTVSRVGLRTDAKQITRIGQGGLSGLPLARRSTELIDYIWRQSAGSIPIIASGGIFTAVDTNEKIASGASLIQVWTGFIYEGPSIVRNILEGMSKGVFKTETR